MTKLIISLDESVTLADLNELSITFNHSIKKINQDWMITDIKIKK